MPLAPDLPTNVTPGYPGHAALHNDVNESVNLLAADTGWRELPIEWAESGLLCVRRIGADVVVQASWSNQAELPAGSIPVGFVPPVGPSQDWICFAQDSFEPSTINISHLGVVSTSTAGAFMVVSTTYPTADPWPDPLPGTPYTP